MYNEEELKTKQALKSINYILEYLDTEEMYCSNTEWRDKSGISFHTDIGYFYEGLIDFKKMLEMKLKGEINERIRNN